MITYTVATNIITVTGYSEATPCNFTDLWTADKAGTLSLHARTGIAGTDGAGVAVDRAERPADNIVLGGASNDLYITVANWNGTTATIRITGTDRDGAAQTEDIVVNANGAFYTTKWFKTITHTQVTAFTATSFDYDLTQGQWGVVWKQSNEQFRFDCDLQTGTAGATGYFRDTKKQLRFGLNYKFLIEAMGYVKLGTLVSVSEKLGKDGCNFIFDLSTMNNRGLHLYGGGSIEAYSSSFSNIQTGWGGIHELVLNDSKTIRFWNCDFVGGVYVAIMGAYSSGAAFSHTIFNDMPFGIAAMGVFGSAVFDNIVTHEQGYGSFILDAANVTISNFKLKEITYQTFYIKNGTGNYNFINFDCAWTFVFRTCPTLTVNRQYTFNLKVTDKDGNNINGASVKIWDKDDTLIVDTITSSGVITEQTITRGYYNEANGNTLQDASPHTIEIKKAGYKTYKKKFTMDKTDWTIALQKVLDNNFSKRCVINNY